MKQFLFFMHIPKTAGTSLNTIIKLQYKQGDIYPWSNIKFWDRIEDFKRTPKYDDDKMNKVILKGHYPFGLHDYINRDFRYTTFLREPISRSISHLMQFVRMPNSSISQEIEKHGLNYVLEKYSELAFENLQSRWIAGLGRDLSIGNEELYERAKFNLDKHFPVFGITEKFDESILLMQKEFNWRFPPFYSVLNKTKNTEIKNIEISSEIREKIEKMNIVDSKLYKYAVDKFDDIGKINKRDLKSFRMKLKAFQFAHNIYLYFRGGVKKQS